MAEGKEVSAASAVELPTVSIMRQRFETKTLKSFNKTRITVSAAFPLLRSPRGEIFGVSTDPLANLDRVVFWMDVEGTVTFMGVLSHAKNTHKGLHTEEFVVSSFYY